MSGSASESNRSVGGANATGRSAAGEPSAPGAPAIDLLRSVMEQTLQPLEAGEPLDRAALEQLGDVVRRRRAEPFTLEPVGQEFILAILRPQLGSSTDSASMQTMAGEIARVLFDDPAARARLEALWNRLCAL